MTPARPGLGALARFFLALTLLLWPWPGLGAAFSRMFAATCAATLGALRGADVVVDFQVPVHTEHPWWCSMSVTNLLTGESLAIPVDTRTVAYLRVAVFVALTLAWPGLREIRWRSWLAGCALLAALNVLALAMPLLQILGMVGALQLGPLAQSSLSVGIRTLVTYPSMAYAVPAFVWILTVVPWTPPGPAPRARGDVAPAVRQRASLDPS